MNSPNQHIPVSNIDPGKNVGDGGGAAFRSTSKRT